MSVFWACQPQRCVLAFRRVDCTMYTITKKQKWTESSFFLESLGDKFTIFNAAIIPWMVKLHSANIVCYRLFTVPLFLRKIVTPTSALSVHMAARTGKPSIPTILRTFPIGVALLEISLQSKTDMFSPWQSGFRILVWMFVRSQAVFLHTQSQTAPTFPGDKEEDVVMRLTIHLHVTYMEREMARRKR